MIPNRTQGGGGGLGAVPIGAPASGGEAAAGASPPAPAAGGFWASVFGPTSATTGAQTSEQWREDARREDARRVAETYAQGSFTVERLEDRVQDGVFKNMALYDKDELLKSEPLIDCRVAVFKKGPSHAAVFKALVLAAEQAQEAHEAAPLRGAIDFPRGEHSPRFEFIKEPLSYSLYVWTTVDGYVYVEVDYVSATRSFYVPELNAFLNKLLAQEAMKGLELERAPSVFRQ